MSPGNNDRDRSIALAALFQATHLVARIARHGSPDSSATQASIYSLFQIDADSTENIFGGIQGVTVGLQRLQSHLTGKVNNDIETSRYVIALLHLERKLMKHKEMVEKIRKGIELATQRLDHFSLLHENIVAQLADIYAETVSTLQPRIMVQGEPLHLQNQDNINLIRALLLAGIRAALLWRQCGGSRLQLLFGRKKIAAVVKQLLQEAEAPMTMH
jgi:high frequency lysogenization protein